jgi:hypothetical protein
MTVYILVVDVIREHKLSVFVISVFKYDKYDMN